MATLLASVRKMKLGLAGLLIWPSTPIHIFAGTFLKQDSEKPSACLINALQFFSKYKTVQCLVFLEEKLFFFFFFFSIKVCIKLSVKCVVEGRWNDESCKSGIQNLLLLDLFHFFTFLVKPMNNILSCDTAYVWYTGSDWITINRRAASQLNWQELNWTGYSKAEMQIFWFKV